MPQMEPILNLLIEIYGEETGGSTFAQLRRLIDQYRSEFPNPGHSGRGELTHRDAILITYGDQINDPGKAPLRILAEFCSLHLKDLVNGIHILPFFPYSSDDGFSVIDYTMVDPELGSWDDVAALGKDFHLMFDAVINHISAHSAWFRAYLRGDPEFRNYFIEITGSPDLSKVVRPRALPLLTSFSTSTGSKLLWTTFSTDQIDLNYHNPQVLLKVIEILLFYVDKGARFIRLDAIAYLWKEVGTPCIHLPQTHAIIRLLRGVLDIVSPDVYLITETNVPHNENISYFGDGTDEAQLVYNFALPPLVLHALQTGSTYALSKWAEGLKLPSKNVTFFNFLASHDGIGLNPVRGILSDMEIEALVTRAKAHGGLVSYKQNPDGSQTPYELNINYFDALNDPHKPEPGKLRVDRFMAAQAIMLALAGMPGIYFHSLFGSRGWPEGVQQTGRNRTINRQKLDRAKLEAELNDPGSLRHAIFGRFEELLEARASSPAFHPNARQEILRGGDAIYALLRTSKDNSQQVLCLHNLSGGERGVSIEAMMKKEGLFTVMKDLTTGQIYSKKTGQAFQLQPYQVAWLNLE